MSFCGGDVSGILDIVHSDLGLDIFDSAIIDYFCRVDCDVVTLFVQHELLGIMNDCVLGMKHKHGSLIAGVILPNSGIMRYIEVIDDGYRRSLINSLVLQDIRRVGEHVMYLSRYSRRVSVGIGSNSSLVAVISSGERSLPYELCSNYGVFCDYVEPDCHGCVILYDAAKHKARYIAEHEWLPI